MRRGNALIDEYQTMASLNRFEMRNLKKALKQYTERFVTPHFLDAPVWARSYYKPLGYPGDFQVMKYVYDRGQEGETLYAQLMHFLGVEMGAFVRNRMQFTRDLIQTLLAEKDAPIRITNVGCGMAYEVASLLETIDPITKRVHFTLVDQDDRALEPAYLMAHKQSKRHHPNVVVESFNTTFKKLTQPSALFDQQPRQTLIYSLGILDYLPARKAKQFVHGLYERLEPGGYLLIANVADGPNKLMWPLSYIFDWELIYRTEQEMYQLATGLDAASVKVQQDATNHVHLLLLQKP
ncbi:hypothetical protein Pse7367_3762 (plasmid) [Thalassoporum mexicanum PCC 7367]|nr:hypothetical protein Pse7367_3762 [Pseudanabaena sp. PCC 7367]